MDQFILIVMKKFSRYLSVMFCLLIGYVPSAQTEPEKDNLFVRIYDQNGKKFEKGKILSMSQDTLYLFRNKAVRSIGVDRIGIIKTKRSVGHNAAIGAATGGVVLGLTGVALGSDDGWFEREHLGAAGLVFGSVAGAGIGALSGAFKNPKTFIINGDPQNWQVFVDAVAGDRE